MSKITILFTTSIIAEMRSRQADIPADFTGPTFEHADFDILAGFVEIHLPREGTMYLYPSSSIARIKIS